jgi:hypothetical protein
MRPLVLIAILLVAAPSAAQTRRSGDPLERVEAAYADVDFEATLGAAQSAIDSGALEPGQLARAYELLGVAAVALGDAGAARDCFERMLVIDPSRELDDTVPPRLRAPFLEARGRVREGALTAEVSLVRTPAALRIALADGYELVQGVRLHMRAAGTEDYEDYEADYAEELLAPFAAAAEGQVEYWLEVLDPRGNRLLVVGSAFSPNVLGEAPRTVVAAAPTPAGRSIAEEPVFWIIVGAVAVVGAGVGIGIGAAESQRVQLQTTFTFPM